MNKLFFVFLFYGLTFPLSLKAHLAIVDVQQGYTEVRVNPSENSSLLTLLQNNTAVLIDGIYLEEYSDTDWLKIYFAGDPYCLECSPDLTMHQSGFVRTSHLVDIESLKQSDTTIFKMIYTIRLFDVSTKTIQYFDSTASTIASINGKAYFGADCGLPNTEIVQAIAVLKHEEFSIPMTLLWSILNAGSNFRYFCKDDSYFALQDIGDGACVTSLVWVFDEKGLKQRMLGWSY